MVEVSGLYVKKIHLRFLQQTLGIFILKQNENNRYINYNRQLENTDIISWVTYI